MKLFSYFQKFIIILFIILIIVFILPHKVTCEEIFSYPPELLKAIKEGIINSIYTLVNKKEFIEKYVVLKEEFIPYFSKAYIKNVVERLSLANISYYKDYNVIQLKEYIYNLFLEDIAKRKNSYKYHPINRDINKMIIVNNIILSIKHYITINLKPKVEVSWHFIPVDILNTIEIMKIIAHDPITQANNLALEIYGIEHYLYTASQKDFLREQYVFIWKE